MLTIIIATRPGATVPERTPERPVVHPAEHAAGQERTHHRDDDGDLGAADLDLAGQLIDEEGGQRTEGDQLAVGEVGEAGRAEDHRQAERGHRQQHGEHEPAHDELECLDALAGLAGGPASPTGKITVWSLSMLIVRVRLVISGLVPSGSVDSSRMTL